MVEVKFESAKEKANAKVQKVHLTSDMHTSINMDAYPTVNDILWVRKPGSVQCCWETFPQSHTVENMTYIFNVKASLMEEWGINTKVTCNVTDGAPNMAACARELTLQHHIYITDTKSDCEEAA